MILYSLFFEKVVIPSSRMSHPEPSLIPPYAFTSKKIRTRITDAMQNPTLDSYIVKIMCMFAKTLMDGFHQRYYNQDNALIDWLRTIQAYTWLWMSIGDKPTVTFLGDALDNMTNVLDTRFDEYPIAYVDTTQNEKLGNIMGFHTQLDPIISTANKNNIVFVIWPYDRMCRLPCCADIPNNICDHAIRELFELIDADKAAYIAVVHTVNSIPFDTPEDEHNFATFHSGSENFKNFLQSIQTLDRTPFNCTYERIPNLCKTHEVTIERENNVTGETCQATSTVEYLLLKRT